MRVLISGASGLVGTALSRSLTAGGHEVRRLVRHRDKRRRGDEFDAAFWDPASGILDPGALDGVDAVVHLAGKNIAGGGIPEGGVGFVASPPNQAPHLVAAGHQRPRQGGADESAGAADQSSHADHPIRS